MRLTQAQVEHRPGIDTDKPVSRQRKQDLYHYFAWPPYWSAPGSISAITPILETGEEAMESHPHDPHLRSLREVIGYHLQALDDELGHVEDFIASDAAWSIAYVLIQTRNWLPSRRVLVPSAWVDNISWADRKMSVKSPRDIIEYSPGVDVSTTLGIDQEQVVYDYYEKKRPLRKG